MNFLDKKNDILVKVINASKRSSIEEHLVNNSTCADSYNINRFKIIKTCSNVFDLQKDFGYTVSLYFKRTVFILFIFSFTVDQL